jgi:hypothetical protein
MSSPDTPAGGAVAYAVRDHSDGQLWLFVRSREDAEKTAENADDEVVPLYTQPPATVPLDAVLALVEKWRERAAEMDDICDIDGSIVTSDCADELAQLLGDTHA